MMDGSIVINIEIKPLQIKGTLIVRYQREAESKAPTLGFPS
jgi:hypothetical protein